MLNSCVYEKIISEIGKLTICLRFLTEMSTFLTETPVRSSTTPLLNSPIGRLNLVFRWLSRSLITEESLVFGDRRIPEFIVPLLLNNGWALFVGDGRPKVYILLQ